MFFSFLTGGGGGGGKIKAPCGGMADVVIKLELRISFLVVLLGNDF